MNGRTGHPGLGGPRTAGCAAPVAHGPPDSAGRVLRGLAARLCAAAAALTLVCAATAALTLVCTASAASAQEAGAVLDLEPVRDRVVDGRAESEGVDAKVFKAYDRLLRRLDKESVKGLADDLAKLSAVTKEGRRTLAGDAALLALRDEAAEEGRAALGALDATLVEFTGLLDSDADRQKVLNAASRARGLGLKGNLALDGGNVAGALSLWRRSALKFARADALARKLREKALRGDPEWDVPLQDIGGALLAVWGETGPAPALYAVGADDGAGATFLVLAHAGEAWVRLPVEAPEDLWWVTGVPGDGVWASGTSGLVVRWDPVRGVLTDRSTGVDATLFGVWGTGADDVWAVGGDPDGSGPVPALLHWDGDAWTPVDVPAGAQGKMLYKVWGTAADDVWACGQGGVVLHFDGESWSAVTSGTASTLLTVHGPDPVVAVGGGGVSAVIVERGGAGTFAPATVPPGTTAMNGVFVPASGDPLAVGFSRTVLRRGTTGWEALPGVPSTARDLHAVWIDDEGNAVMAGGNLFSLETGTLVTFGRRTLPSEIVPFASFADIVADVLFLNCAEAGCHLAPFLNEGLDFTDPDATLETTVNVASRQSPLLRVVPGRPSRSYLWHKLQGTQATVGGSGDAMPQGAPALPAEDLAAIRAWILAGAPDDR